MKLYLTVIVSATFLFIFSCDRGDQKMVKEEEPRHAELAKVAPPFTLQDVQGNEVSLSDFLGSVVIIDFWTTWCHSCKEATQELEELKNIYENQGVKVLGISMDEGGKAVGKVIDFTEQHNLTYTMLMDDKKTSRSYGVNRIPMTYILDKKHIIKEVYVGYIPGLKDRIAAHVEDALVN